MKNVKKVSMAVVKRLPKYHQCLGELIKNNVERISSQDLSKLLGFTASQIRQDLNNFGEFGQQGYGYNVEQLYNAIAKILGLTGTHKVIVIGAGNLGQALANYIGFEEYGFKIIALFDVNPKLVGLKVRGIPIFDVKELENFINKNQVDIAILTVPKEVADETAKVLLKTSVRGIWNFSPIELEVANKMIVEDVHLSDNLLTLNYRINEEKLQEKLRRKNLKKCYK